MATRFESQVVNAAGVVQGVALVTFPAASSVLTDKSDYDLSSTQYGAMFVPQFILAIISALVGATVARRVGTKSVYIVGLVANLVSMTLLLLSVPFAGDTSAYVLLLCATACLGVGFGLTVPAINTFAADFHPERADAAVLVLNALLGLGTALAPLLVAVFVGAGVWWLLPALMVVAVFVVMAVSLRLPLQTTSIGADKGAAAAGARSIPSRFWLFAAFAVLYGICETMNGNWSVLDMTGNLGASATVASLALMTFWGMVTVGRVVFAKVPVPTSVTFHILPFVLAAAFVLIALLPSDSPVLGILAFGVAGLGCSALLPLSISFAQEQLVTMSSAVAGGIIAFYQLGYGIAAFGAGPLQSAGVELPTIFGFTAVIALVAGFLSFALTAPPGKVPTGSMAHGPEQESA